jgi:hypothetical protein
MIPVFEPDRALLRHAGFLVAGIACWSVFSLYWESAAKKAAAAKSSESRASRNVHLFLMNIALLLEILPIQGFGRWVRVSPWIMAVGLVVEAAGLSLAIWARPVATASCDTPSTPGCSRCTSVWR